MTAPVTVNFTSASRLFCYKEYIDYVSTMHKQGLVTGNTQTEALLNHTKMNLHRMQRIEKTFKLSEPLADVLSNLSKPQTWYLITEGWCGDSSQISPVISGIANSTNKIDLKLLLRDENPEIMDAYLTNGGRAVPKLISINTETGNELFTWGPRPQTIQDKVNAYKLENPEMDKVDFAKNIHSWYSQDKTMAVQNELAKLLREVIL